MGRRAQLLTEKIEKAYYNLLKGASVASAAKDCNMTNPQLLQCFREQDYDIEALNLYTKAKCKVCDKIYVQNRDSQKFCSKACSSKVAKERLSDSELMRQKSFYAIFHRDDFTCAYCGKNSIVDKVKLEIDHVFPISKGGDSQITNLVTACETCNHAKHNKILNEKTLFKIWRRNHQLNLKFDAPKYKELQRVFNRVFQNRHDKYK